MYEVTSSLTKQYGNQTVDEREGWGGKKIFLLRYRIWWNENKTEKCTLPPRGEVVWGNDLAPLLPQCGHFLHSKAQFQEADKVVRPSSTPSVTEVSRGRRPGFLQQLFICITAASRSTSPRLEPHSARGCAHPEERHSCYSCDFQEE